jgi:dihydroorotase
MTSLLISRGRVVDPASSLDAACDIRVDGSRIVEIAPQLQPKSGEPVIDAAGCIVAPGFIDMHVHLREPGFTEKETIATGTEAAVRGGFTAVACMPNTLPALDDPSVLQQLNEIVEHRAHCRVYPIAAITRGRRGTELCDFAALAQAGAVAFSDDGDTVRDARLMREAALRTRELRAPLIAHSEPEESIVARDLEIAAETKKAWHVAHVSTRGALDLIRAARAAGTTVTCEATPHHLTFTEAIAGDFGAASRVNPPLRRQDDVAALREAIYDNTVDAFATDHAPHTAEQKRDGSAPGFTGLEIAVGAYAAALEDLPLTRFVQLLSTNPARILGVPGGALSVGAPADVTIFADRAWNVDPQRFASKGKCTPFSGARLPRRIVATIVDGELRYRAPESVA